jgi:hypothetical protein
MLLPAQISQPFAEILHHPSSSIGLGGAWSASMRCCVSFAVLRTQVA